MKLGEYDSLMAKNRAARFLAASIGEMHQLMTDENVVIPYYGGNPYVEGTLEYNAMTLVYSELKSLQALKDE
jgi:hypothetical protein